MRRGINFSAQSSGCDWSITHFLAINLLWLETLFIPPLVVLNFLGKCICGLSCRVDYVDLQNLLSQCQRKYFAIKSCLVHFMGLNFWSLKRHISNLMVYSFGSMWKDHLRTIPPPHAGHQLGYALLWDGIPFFKQHLLQVSQCVSVGDSGTNSTPKPTPEVFNGVDVRTAAHYHAHSWILKIVSDKPHPVRPSIIFLENRVRSQKMEIMNWHWLENYMLRSLCINSTGVFIYGKRSITQKFLLVAFNRSVQETVFDEVTANVS